MTKARGASVDAGPKAGTASPPFAHTPYDGSARPFTVGLMPLDLADWIEPDALLAAHLAEKDRLLSGAAQAPVLLAEENTRQTQQEVLGLLAGHLPARFPDLYARHGQRMEIIGTGRSVDLDEPCDMPLALAARLVQEDLVVMRKGETGYRLAAAALFFPSSWSLADKFGKSMEAIHETVPGFNDGRMGPMVARIFDNLAIERPSWRLNWSLYSDPGLHHPSPKRISAGGSDTSRVDGAREALHVRVERQTLRRLPDSGDILFTIKVHHDPVAAFARHPQGAMLAAGLRRQLLELDADQLAYKGLAAERDAIAARLEALSGSADREPAGSGNPSAVRPG